MSLARIWRVLRKDYSLGPRSPLFLAAIIVPFAMTLLVQVVFGSLFEPTPRLGIVDAGQSQITAALSTAEDIEVTRFDDAAALKRAVQNNDIDVGVVLGSDFDAAIAAESRPPLEIYAGGESLASNRIILEVTTLDAVRALDGQEAPVDVKLVTLGDAAALPLAERLVPMLVMYALVMAGVVVPAASLIEEGEKGTMAALLVTPLKASEAVAAKALLGVSLAFLMSVVTLALNGALGNAPAMIIVLLVSSVFATILGVLLGVTARSAVSMMAVAKVAGIFILAPVVFYLFPEWPQWVAKIFPTFWMIDPIWQVGVLGKGLTDVWVDLVVAVGVTLVLIPVVVVLARRMQSRVAVG